MIVKRKAYFLKKDVPMSELENFGFVTLNGGCSYWRDIKNDLYRLVCYSDSRIIKLKALRYCWTIRVKKYIHDLIEANLVYKKNYYYVVTWNSRKWSEAKKERITKKICRLQDIENRKEVEE